MQIYDLPAKPALYYFYENNNLMYIGKSHKLKYRLIEHYNNYKITRPWLDLFYDKFYPCFEKNDTETILNKQKLFGYCYAIILETQPIDLIFNRVTHFEIKPMKIKGLKEKELLEIKTLKPKLNHETRQYDDIDLIYDKLNKVSLFLLKQIF